MMLDVQLYALALSTPWKPRRGHAVARYNRTASCVIQLGDIPRVSRLTRRSCSLVRHEAIAACPPWPCQSHWWPRRASLHRGVPTNLGKPSSSAALQQRATRAGSRCLSLACRPT